jgi:hypothetical protein
MDRSFTLVLLVFAFSSASLARAIARSMGLPENGWMLAGFFLGPLGVLGAAGMADRKLQEALLRQPR